MTWKKLLWSDDAVIVRKNSGANIGTRPRLNFIEGSNISLAISDDAGSDEIDISIAVDTGVFLTNGTRTMAADMDMGDFDINGINTLKAHDVSAIQCEDHNGNSRIQLATADYAFFAYADVYMNSYTIKAVKGIILKDASELTIASGVVTATQSYHKIDTEADAASDDLVTINGGTAGQELTIRATDSARTVVAKDGTGNLKLNLASDMNLDNAHDTLTLIYDGANWLETGRSNNGA